MKNHLKFSVTLLIVVCILEFSSYLFMQNEQLRYNNLKSLSLNQKNKNFMIGNSDDQQLKRVKPPINMTFIDLQLHERLKIASSKTEPIKILLWDLSPGNVDLQDVDPNNCGHCKVVFHKSMVTDPATKAVIFHYSELPWTVLPRLRLDADIWGPYTSWPQSLIKRHNIDDIIKKKRNLALWVVSNCDGTDGAVRRLAYVKRLVEDGLKLDVGGRCFPHGLKNFDYSHYKFYLAFENSVHCKDYITEKFFQNALNYDVVPVVFGAHKRDYERRVPPSSFIFATDYSNKELIDLLNYLDRNNSAYLEYFQWKQAGHEFSELRATGVCQLCRYLHGINYDNIFSDNFPGSSDNFTVFSNTAQPAKVPSLTEWLYGGENPDCAERDFLFYDRTRYTVVVDYYTTFSLSLIFLACLFCLCSISPILSALLSK